jgi:type I restriction enzyme S subunit
MSKAIVPNLRFKEFSDDWEIKELGEIGKLVSGLTYSPDDIRDNGLLVLRSSNVQNGEIVLGDNVFVTPDVKGVNLSQPNDILICVRNGSKTLIGKNALIPTEMPLCTHGAFMTIFRAKYADFVFQLFQTQDYRNQVDGDLGATINSINGKQFIKYRFKTPKHKKEQQKIADCLSAVDELISTQAEKIATLKANKKGLMQKLFPQEGEKIPKFRFKEFGDDWEVKKLSEIVDYKNGKAHKQDIVNSKFIYTDGMVKKFTNSVNSPVKKDDVLNCPIILPKELKEQQKIVDCLSSINELISTQAEKITTIKAYKKGLMQQLFCQH